MVVESDRRVHRNDEVNAIDVCCHSCQINNVKAVMDPASSSTKPASVALTWQGTSRRHQREDVFCKQYHLRARQTSAKGTGGTCGLF